MYKEIIRWLKAGNINVSRAWLRLRLESHPDYPSLSSIQDTLSELNIRCDAYDTSREELLRWGKPFLIPSPTSLLHPPAPFR